jgi:hypothetical protein
VKPFFAQHLVRGMFGDPRIGPGSNGVMQHTLHFGIDVVAPDGTPVYATLSGWVSIHPLHADTVMISDGSGRVFEYWHVVPAMRSGHATAYLTVIGHVEAPWAHVHFAERQGSRYVNPLHPGGIGPYVDTQSPRIVEIDFERGGREAESPLSGTVDVVAEAWDEPAVPVPEPWNAYRLTLALVRWRLVPAGARTAAWETAFDARTELPSASFFSVFADGTRQNRTYRVGRYRFLLARSWNTAALADGAYTIEVSVADIRGNAATLALRFATANR